MCFAGPIYIPRFHLQIQEIVKLFHNQSILWTTGFHLRIKYKKKESTKNISGNKANPTRSRSLM